MTSARTFSQRAAWAAGQPISELMSRALDSPNLISLAAGFVDQQTLPAEPTRLALDAIFADPQRARAALQYGTTPGYPPLRRLLLEQLFRQDGLEQKDCSIDQLVITAGSNQLLHLIAETLLDPNDIVLCASPSYLVFLGTLGNLGARSIGVASDDQGMDPEALLETLRGIEAAGQLARVKAIYLVPYFDNPRGVTMPQSRRIQIVEIAKRWSREKRIYVISDEAYRALNYTGEDVPGTWACDPEGDTVIMAGTFSKCFSPGIRIGWGVLPPELVEPVCEQKGNIDFGSPNFGQHLMAEVMQQGLLMPHIERIQTSYHVKLRAMLEAADEHLGGLPGVSWLRPQGGLYVWLELPQHIDTGPAGQLFEVAVAEGVFYVPGQFCYPREGEAVKKNTMRLSFGVQPPEKIREGVQALARAIHKVTAGQ